jgi:hypothetical protein
LLPHFVAKRTISTIEKFLPLSFLGLSVLSQTVGLLEEVGFLFLTYILLLEFLSNLLELSVNLTNLGKPLVIVTLDSCTLDIDLTLNFSSLVIIIKQALHANSGNFQTLLCVEDRSEAQKRDEKGKE